VDGRDYVLELGGGNVTFYGVLAVRRWTPFQEVVVVDVRAVQECQISIISRDEKGATFGRFLVRRDVPLSSHPR
jgi:hypothetical protein